MKQGTDEWFDARLGKVTASNLYKIMPNTKGNYSAERAKYMMQLLAEKLTEQRQDSFVNEAMLRGIELENTAREAYENFKFCTVEQVGFIDHPSINNFGASPDGFVEDGLIEIKCPASAKHLNTLLEGNIDTQYRLQMHAQMMCSGRTWCDFVSFDDRLPPNLALCIIRVEQDATLIQNIENEVNYFNDELNELLMTLKTKEDAP